MLNAELPLNPGEVEIRLKELKDTFPLVDPEIRDWAQQYAGGHVDHYKSVVENLQYIVGSNTRSRILDVGSVPGHLSVMLKRAGFFVEAVDINPERAGRVYDSMGIPFHRVNVETEPLPFPNPTFDVVLFCELLEHLRNHPINALREIYRVLLPGGVLLLSTPNITPLMRWRFLLGEDFQDDLINEFAKLDTIGHMGHFRLYSRKEVEKLLTHIGFHVTRVNTGGSLKKHKHWDARVLRKMLPRQMRTQLYVTAKK
jgi:SAM-dependent methyltransferase